MRKKLLATALGIALLLALLWPLSMKIEGAQMHADQTAEALVQPIIDVEEAIETELAQSGVPVGSVIELEDAWAIEDTREESWEPLVRSMVNGADALAYDAEKNTFYCTLGMETGDEWPQLSLAAKNAPDGIEIRMVDDYTYDWCSDAIREGYRYELLAYTESQYSYFGIVFTGLPIVSIQTGGQTIGDAYIPARASIAAAGFDAVDTAAKVHLRGGGFKKLIDKQSYRLEFHAIDEKGRDRRSRLSVLGMEADSDWLLIGNPSDETAVRNHLCWDMWNKWNPNGGVPTLLGSELVEVFVNDEYMGLYQLMQRVDHEKEILQMGGDTQTDYVYRIIREPNINPKRPARNYYGRTQFWAEQRYRPEYTDEEQAFALFEPYVEMSREYDVIDEEEFRALAEEHIDLEPLLSYFLFHQAADLTDDNVNNNLFIWLLRNEDGGYTYHLSPWDMDFGFTTESGEDSERDQLCLVMRMPRRILDMNLGESRQILYDIWAEKRSTILTDDAVYQWMMDMEEWINRSGAFLREHERWYGEAIPLDLSLLTANEIAHMATIDREITELWPIAGQ